MADRSPILVTGGHRSGTGWVSDTLAATPAPIVASIWEPFSLRARRGVRNAPFRYWFTYVCDENAEQFRAPLAKMLDFRYGVGAELPTLRTPKDGARLMRDWLASGSNRRRGAVPLMKDPIAVFSADWIADTFDADVIVMIRHPAAFVNSIVRQGWWHPFDHFLRQPLMMRDVLAPHRDVITRFAEQPQPLLDQAALLWLLIHERILHYRDARPDWTFVRHEDLSTTPQAGFRSLFDRLGLAWSPGVEAMIAEDSGAGNPHEAANPRDRRRDSRAAITAWKRRLSHEDIDAVRERTSPIWPAFYGEEDW